MKRFHKYNLTTINLPREYRFIKRGETYESNDVYWVEKRDGIENYMERSEQYPGAKCDTNWPKTNPFSTILHGYIRKIE